MPAVPGSASRLLLVVNDRPGLRGLVSRELPGVSYAFLSEIDPPSAREVEAVLLGSIAREGSTWDPSAYPALRFVQRIFAGVDDVPFDRIPPRVAVAGNVGGYAPFVAEHAVALALAAARCVLAGTAAVAAGRSRPAPELRSLWQESALVLGYGAIGRAIAERLRPFEMRISGLNRTGTMAPGVETMFPAERLDEAVASAGYVFDARPLTRATRGSLARAQLERMREDATLVNVGRGGTIDEEALYRHLTNHPRFRVGLDVWWQEDFTQGALQTRFPFSGLPNFVGSPHWAGLAPRVGEFALRSAVENLARFFQGKPPLHVVDRREYLP